MYRHLVIGLMAVAFFATTSLEVYAASAANPGVPVATVGKLGMRVRGMPPWYPHLPGKGHAYGVFKRFPTAGQTAFGAGNPKGVVLMPSVKSE